jgi:hypothetical protein
MTADEQIADLKRTINQLEEFGTVSFDVVIDLYKILDMIDPERTYDPKNLKNVNKDRLVDYLRKLRVNMDKAAQRYNDAVEVRKGISKRPKC